VTEPWAADVDVTGELARSLIEAQFPELAGASIAPLGEGWDNAAFLVSGEYVFRFPRRTVAAPLIAREIAILPMLAPHLPHAISAPHFAGTPTALYPWPFAGYRSFRGRPLSAIHLDDAAFERVAADLGIFLSALHRIDPAPAIAAGLPEDEIGRLDHTERISKLDARFAALSSAGLIRETATLLDCLNGIAPAGPRRDRLCIVHGDLYAKHIFVDKDGGVRGVIDWGDIHLGDPAIDVSVAFELLPLQARSVFEQAYGPIDERTRELARYRAIYHAALVAYYGYRIGNDETLRAGLTGLKYAIP
jgi:aminoglycoside phosphotransferase (APT) family kinase protein